MEKMLNALKEAAELRISMAKKEAAFWEKIAEAISCYEPPCDSDSKVQDELPTIKTKSPDEYLTTSQTAKYLNVKNKTLEAWRVKGGGPKYNKFGSLVRYKVSDLDIFTKEKEFPHTSAYLRKK